MPLGKPRLLNGCAKSKFIADAFEALGWEAWTCDILPAEGPGNHIQDDVLKHLDDGWDMAIFHPPCTHITRAGARWLYHKVESGMEIDLDRLRLGEEATQFFLKLLRCRIPRIAVENPTPLRIFNLPKPTMSINPHEFGEPYSKRTLLWLVNLPPLMPTLHMAEYKPLLPSNTGYGRQAGQRYQFKHITATDASRTFPGIAQAMANQWGKLPVGATHD